MSNYEEHIWFQHKDESDEQYRHFIRYYLPNKSSRDRNVLDSVRKYFIAERGYSEDDANAVKNCNVRFYNWSKGLDTHGDAIPGLVDWEERSCAYWDWMYEDELNKLSERRTHIVEDEFDDGNKMLNEWKILFNSFMALSKKERDSILDDDGIYNPSSHIGQFKNILKTRDELAGFLRRAVGMTDTIKEDVFANALKDDNVKIEWKEPESLKYEKDDVDELLDDLSPEDFEKLLDKLSDNEGRVVDYGNHKSLTATQGTDGDTE